MEELFDKFYRRLETIDLNYIRGIMNEISWDVRLIGIRGARGVGKTTLMLQYIKKNLSLDGTSLYVSLDNIWFAENRLVDLADEFVKKGGKYLFLDEVHKYPDWSIEIKNIYDYNPHLHIVFTGSSLLEILNARADLSRRAITYTMQGLSYREYLNLILEGQLPVMSIEEILENHTEIVYELTNEVEPLKYYEAYLKSGYYPFFLEQPQLYHQRLEEVINMILEIELPHLRKLKTAYVNRVKQLLQIVAQSVPFKPNVSKLSDRIGINRNTLVSYLYYLQEAHIIKHLYKDAKGITQLQKPDKIYLENTNLQYTLARKNVNSGNIRETFFINQLGRDHLVEYSEQSDFLVDGKYTFEVGGKNKSGGQLKGIENSFIASDDLIYGTGKKIPLWLFGFLY